MKNDAQTRALDRALSELVNAAILDMVINPPSGHFSLSGLNARDVTRHTMSGYSGRPVSEREFIGRLQAVVAGGQFDHADDIAQLNGLFSSAWKSIKGGVSSLNRERKRLHSKINDERKRAFSKINEVRKSVTRDIERNLKVIVPVAAIAGCIYAPAVCASIASTAGSAASTAGQAIWTGAQWAGSQAWAGAKWVGAGLAKGGAVAGSGALSIAQKLLSEKGIDVVSDAGQGLLDLYLQKEMGDIASDQARLQSDLAYQQALYGSVLNTPTEPSRLPVDFGGSFDGGGFSAGGGGFSAGGGEVASEASKASANLLPWIAVAGLVMLLGVQ